MILGVTGTRFGMTHAQRLLVTFYIEKITEELYELHHGLCKGVDIQVRDIVREVCPSVNVFARPGPDGDGWRGDALAIETVLPGKGHFSRNRDIVDVCNLLLVIPKDNAWQRFGGTWYTHDYAVKKSKPVVVVWPDGVLEHRSDLGKTTVR